jgi:hypothetical protein
MRECFFVFMTTLLKIRFVTRNSIDIRDMSTFIYCDTVEQSEQ